MHLQEPALLAESLRCVDIGRAQAALLPGLRLL